MTDTRKITAKRKAGGAIPLTLTAAALTILFILDTGGARDAVISSLKLSVMYVVPAVFPCAVLSGIIVRLGGAKKLGSIAERPMRALFSLPGEAMCALLLGFFCGFPIGAKTCAELYAQGGLSRDEAERLLAFSSLPSPAFVMNAVGSGMLGSRRAGVFLFAALVALSLAAGVVMSFPSRKRKGALPSFAPAAEESTGFIPALIGSVNSGADAMIRLCAFSAFFSALSASLSPLTSLLPDAAGAALTGLFELTGGCTAATGCDLPLPTVAAVLGWTGLAVHFQILSVAGKDLSPKRYFLVSLLRSTAMFFVAFFVRIPLSDI